MSDMIERVARLLWAAFARDGTYDEDRHDDVPFYLATARAAIEAMREPSEGVRQAGEEALAKAEDDDSEVGLHETIPQTVFKAMIDAALQGK